MTKENFIQECLNTAEILESLRVQLLNLETFDYFTTKILYFYIRKELKKYMNLFYIQENFYFELID